MTLAKAVTYSRRIKLYPLSQAADPPATTFLDASDVLFDSTIRYDLTFFESLDKMVQVEPWLERDKAMIDPLKTIGIERGKPFTPSAKTKKILSDAIREARAWFEARYDIIPPFYDGRRWFFPSTEEMFQNVMKDWHVPDSYPIDARGTVYSLAFFSAKHLGESQYDLLTGRDEGGNAAAWRLELSPQRAGARPGHAVLVDDRLRPRDARLHPECRAGWTFVAVSGLADER